MIIVTPAARQKLLALIREHPEDPIVRLTLQDLDHDRLAFSITLEPAAQSGEEVQDFVGLTVALEARAAPRMDGMTLDYLDPGGFKFIHPRDAEDERLGIINLN
jgi:Fe-S cluster assembly iron-binding protein IscA